MIIEYRTQTGVGITRCQFIKKTKNEMIMVGSWACGECEYYRDKVTNNVVQNKGLVYCTQDKITE